jgi:signal transduction histidine kinase/CheY-like chemotaxis protein
MSQGSRPVCLILSADTAFQDAVANALATLDARLERAVDTGAALAALSVWPIRCVVVDLAASDGWPLVVAKLRRTPELGSTPVLFIADSAEAVDRLLADPPEGHWDLMRQPLHPRWLCAKVGHLVCTELRVARSTAESEAQLAMIDALPAQVCVVDAQGNILMGNRAWRQQEGIDADHVTGWHYRELCDRAAQRGADHAAVVCAGLADVLRGERGRFEHEYSLGDGDRERRHFLLSIVRLGGDGGAVICQFDTTHQKRAEAERLEAMRHLEMVMDAVQLNLFEYDLATGRRIVGMRDVELLGDHPADLDDMRDRFVHPDDSDHFNQALNSVMAGEDHGSIEYRVGAGDSPRWRCVVARVIGRDAQHPGRLVGASWDITARKLAQIESERLAASRAMALDAGRFNAWEWDFELHRASGGERDAELFGCKIESGEQLVALTHPEDRERVRALWGDEAVPVDRFETEFRIVRADGDVRWIKAVGRLERDARRAPLRQAGLSWDITEQKRADIALRESEAQLRRALDAARMVSWEWDLTQGTRRAIGDDLAVLGESPATIDTAKTRVHPDDLARHLADIDHAIRSGEDYQSEFRVIWPDGSVHWLLSRGTPMRDAQGSVVRLSGLVWDITGRKDAEAALVESRRLQELAIEGAGLNIWEIDLRSGIRHGGPRDIDFYGFSPRTHEDFARIVDSEDAARLDAAMQRAVAGAGQYEVEYGVRKECGQRRWYSALGQLVRGHDGRPDKLVGVTYDITARREQSQAMAKALEAAEQASRAKSSFLAATSHELRTPMNAVLGMTRLLVDTDLDGRQRELLETIRSSGDLLLRLINDVLDFSRIEAGEMPIDATEFDTLACIESSIEIVAQQAEAKGLDLFLDVAPEACRRVRGDPTRVRQILVNVLVNAIKFTDRGEVRLTVQAQPQADGRVEFEFQISDTGIGMSDELIGQVFLPFRQGDGSMTRRHGGTGLGLAICRRLAELMRGEIQAVSLPGEGSRFDIRLPFEDHGSALPEIRNVQVMVASPHRASRDAAVTQLRRFGVSVMSCNGSDPLPEAILVEQQLLLLDDRLFADYPELVDEILARHQRDPAIARMVSLRDTIQRAMPDWVRDLGTVIRPIRPSVLLGLLHEFDAGPRKNAPEASTAPAIAKLSERHPLSILVAEDNLINQMLLQMMLEALGYTCDIANHGREVLVAIEKKAYDLILMDVEMPELDGIEASRAVRLRVGQQDTPQIVAVTAHVLTGSRERFLAAGMNDFVAKPILIDELRAALIRAHEAKLRYQRTALV